MTCYKPIRGYPGGVTAAGKTKMVFTAAEARGPSLLLPCGQCIGCRLDRSLEWATRCMHEAAMHRDNAMLTLTYDERNIPPGNSLSVEDFQLFLKRLRKSIAPKRIKYFHCGEYGDQLGRPHYHAIIFGHDFGDKTPLRRTPAGSLLYDSPTLNELWGLGYTSIGDVTFDSVAYVARYVLKKVTGDPAPDHYQGRKPEYTTMSNGIGKAHFLKYYKSIMANDSIIMDGKELKVPKYYDKLAANIDKELLDINKLNREMNAPADNPEQREMAHVVKLLSFNHKRGLSDVD